MALFGERAACPQCGRNVRKPDDPSSFLCPRCDRPGPWATDEQVAGWEIVEADRRAAEVERDRARERYEKILDQMSETDADIHALLPQLKLEGADADLSDAEAHDLHLAAVSRFIEVSIADGVLTAPESDHLDQLTEALEITLDMVDFDLASRATVAAINGGNLPAVPEPHLMLKSGEVVHAEWPAFLLKEVDVRKYQGGYSGFSFPIGKAGVRYEVGGSKGQSVWLRPQLPVADSGILAVSNQRTVYMGSGSTVEMPYSRMVNIDVFSDGVQFHLANRLNAPVFEVERPDVLAAVVNRAAQAAVQRFAS